MITAPPSTEEANQIEQLTQAVLQAWEAGEHAAWRACFPDGVAFEDRLPLVNKVIGVLEKGQSYCHGFRVLLHDEIVARLRGQIKMSQEMFRQSDERARGGTRLSCEVCPGGLCYRDEDHYRQKLLALANEPVPASDLEELPHDELVRECDRLRRLLPLSLAYPEAPAWVAQMDAWLRAEDGLDAASDWNPWHLSYAGKSRCWSWRSPCRRGTIYRTEGEDRWLVVALAPDGKTSTSDDCASLPELVAFFQAAGLMRT